jgi:hypothetical protein
MEGGAVGHNIEMGLPRDHPCQVWFNFVLRFQRRRFKCDLLSIEKRGDEILIVHCCFSISQILTAAIWQGVV